MHRSRKVTAAAITAGGLLLGTGIAAALELPDQPEPSVAEDKVADIDAPADPQAKATEHRQNETDGDDADVAEVNEATSAGDGERPTDTHGYAVSQLATTSEAEGREKGEAISALAKTNGEELRAADAQDDSGADSEKAGRSAGARAAQGR